MATPVTKPKGGEFVLHAKALHGNPYDGHTLGPVVAEMEELTGVEVRRIHVDKGYRGHTHPNRFRVWISGQVRRVTTTIREGDRANAVLAAAGYNFALLLRWFEALLRALLEIVFSTAPTSQTA